MSSKSFTVRLIADVSAYRAAMREARESGAEMSRRSAMDFQSLGENMVGLGRTMTRRVTLPLVGIGAGAVKVATDFDTSMTRIQSLVGLSADEVDGLRDSVRELSGRTAQSPQQLAEALFFATSAGLDAADAMEAVEFAAKASAVGLGNTRTIVDLTTSAMNAYGSDALDAASATDVLTAAVRLGKLEPDQLAGAMGRVLPVASAMGVEFHEVGAAFAAMSRTGTNANEAATQLRGILATILSPTQQARDALSEVGLSVDGIQASLRDDGLLATLELLVNSMGDNVQASEAVFGNVRALSGVMDMLGSNVDGTRQIFADMTDTAGITAEAFDIVADTAGFKMQQAWADLQNALIDVGNILLPLVTGLVDGVSSLLGVFQSLPDPVQTIIVAFGGVVAAAGPMLMVFGSIIRNLQTIAAMKGAMAFAMNPLVGGLVLAAGAIAFAFMQWRNEADSTSEEMKRMRERMAALREEANHLASALAFGADPVEQFKRSFVELLAENETLRKAFIESGTSIDLLAETAASGAHSFDVMFHSTVEAGRALGFTAEEMREATDDAGFLFNATQRANRIFNELADAGIVAGDSMDGAADSADGMSDSMSDVEEVARTAIEAMEEEFSRLEEAAEEMSSAIDSAMASAASHVNRFSADAKNSLDEFRAEMGQNIIDLAMWQNNLITIAERGGAEFALQMAEYGPEFAGMIAELTELSDDEFAEFVDLMTTGTEVMGRDMVEEFAKVDPEFAAILGALEETTRGDLEDLQAMAAGLALSVGEAIAGGVEDGIERNAHKAATMAARMVRQAMAAARREGEISSPSRLFAAEVGAPIAQGVAMGIERETDRVMPDTFRSVFDHMVSATFTAAPPHIVDRNVSTTTTGLHINEFHAHEGVEVDGVFRHANILLAGVS